jgi:ABC-type branched-subunit amino acid transport system permease subunit
MKKQLRMALSAGVTFGIVTIFLFLIGFTATSGDLLADLFGNKNAAPFMGLTPQTINMLIFLALVGLWAGSYGSRKSKGQTEDPWAPALLGGLTAGLVHGILVGLLALLVGTLNLHHLPINMYLAALLPPVITMFLLGGSPFQGAIFYLFFFTLTGFLGGLLSRGVGRGSWRGRASGNWKNTWDGFNQKPLIKQVRGNPASRYVIYGVLLVLLFLVPLVAGQYWNYTIGTVFIYVLLGLGLNIVVGLAGLLDLGYVAFFAIGAYTMALLTAPAPQHLMWSFWIALPIGVVLAALTGLLLGAPVLRLRGDYLAIVTLGFGEIIRLLSTSDAMTSFSGGPKGVPSIGGPTIFGKPFNSGADFVYLIFLAAILIIFVTNRLQNSRVGRAWEAMREDETVSRAMGINTLTQKLMAFAIGAAFAGLGGALFASRNQFTGPEDFTFMVSVNVVAVVIVGGMGSIPGVIAGALVLKGLPEVLRELQDYRVMVFGALLVVMMLWRPAGIIPSSRRKMEIEVEKDTGVTGPPKEAGEK